MTPIREYVKSFSFSLGNLILGAIVGAIVAGVIGMWVNAYMSRPRLRVAIFSPKLAEVIPEEESDQLPVSAATKLLEECGRTLWNPCFDRQNTLRQYLRSLETASAALESKLEEVPSLRSAAAGWPKQVSDKNSLDKVYETLRANSDLVTMQLVLETNQGLGIFHKSKPQKKTTLPYYGIKQDDDGDFFVMSGSETLQLAWTIYPTGVAKKEMKETFARFAEAVAYGEEDDLNDIHALVERILATEAGARDYRAKLEAEINSYARWTVKAIITNSGKEPVSLSPAAALYVGTQGQKYLDPQGVQSALEGDYRIEMTNTEESMTMGTKTGGGTMSLTPTPMLANSDTPIILPGGSAAAITFRSLGRVRELPDGPIVLDFYRKRNLKCVLLALPITSTPNTFGSPGLAWSEPIAFNEASFGQLFPKNAIW